MRMLMIQPNYHAGGAEIAGNWPPGWVAYIGGALKAAGMTNLRFVDAMTNHINDERLEEIIRTNAPDVVMATAGRRTHRPECDHPGGRRDRVSPRHRRRTRAPRLRGAGGVCRCAAGTDGGRTRGHRPAFGRAIAPDSRSGAQHRACRRARHRRLPARASDPAQRADRSACIARLACEPVAARRDHASRLDVCGSARFTARGGRRTLFRLEDCPICRGAQSAAPLCEYYAATFTRLFSRLVHPRAEARETACIAAGAPACQFEVEWRT